MQIDGDSELFQYVEDQCWNSFVKSGSKAVDTVYDPDIRRVCLHRDCENTITNTLWHGLIQRRERKKTDILTTEHTIH